MQTFSEDLTISYKSFHNFFVMGLTIALQIKQTFEAKLYIVQYQDFERILSINFLDLLGPDAFFLLADPLVLDYMNKLFLK